MVGLGGLIILVFGALLAILTYRLGQGRRWAYLASLAAAPAGLALCLWGAASNYYDPNGSWTSGLNMLIFLFAALLPASATLLLLTPGVRRFFRRSPPPPQ
jgi:hypothetical protein